MVGKTHLVIPDSHAHPDHNNERYSWLGELINDIKPDVVIDIGDFWDMPSLSQYDKGGKSFEGRRYKRDVESGLEAQDRIYEITRRSKRRLPRWVRCLGNHENRIVRAIERDPILEGTIGLDDLESKEYGWEEHPFLEPVSIDGVCYQHYFVSGISGRPISGERIGLSLVAKQLSSCTQGHSHLFDYYLRNNANGSSIHGLSVGVYQDYDADWAGPSNHVWHRGVCVCRGVENGSYDLEFISLKRIKEAYGK